ncbi:MAG: Phospholipase D/Transphosphatidylase, partial [Pedosphaera sp.]|nr:Phospholipase D/Transphosphatidylase [Pedosphaera sp.]
MPLVKSNSYNWLSTGDEVFPAMLAAIESARTSIRFETYIYANDELGRRFRDALVQARERGLRVRVLVDALGSGSLPASFWLPLQSIGGEAHWFNPVLLKRFGFRDHRKVLVCDETTAFVGGFNISSEYQGDGVNAGWCDLGLQLTSPLVADLAAAFDEMFARADIQHTPFTPLHRPSAKQDITA